MTTDQALAESILVKKNLLQNKNELKLLIQKTQAKIANFFNKIFESAPLKTAEIIVFAAQKSTANVSPLETSQAIPILSSS